jgi:RNA polymerase sigma factor (TIGR02999 family)
LGNGSFDRFGQSDSAVPAKGRKTIALLEQEAGKSFSEKVDSTSDERAAREAVVRLYPELRRLARYLLHRERPGHTLQATALANEVAAQLLTVDSAKWADSEHMLAAATRQMRNLLTDYARKRAADKRQIPETNPEPTTPPSLDLLVLDQLLTRLAAIDPRAARVVEFRFYGGLTEAEVASALRLSVPTVQRDWEFARTWLYRALKSE